MSSTLAEMSLGELIRIYYAEMPAQEYWIAVITAENCASTIVICWVTISIVKDIRGRVKKEFLRIYHADIGHVYLAVNQPKFFSWRIDATKHSILSCYVDTHGWWHALKFKTRTSSSLSNAIKYAASIYLVIIDVHETVSIVKRMGSIDANAIKIGMMKI